MAKTWNTDLTKAGKDVKQQEVSFIAGNEKWYSHLDDNLSVSYKTKHIRTIQSSNHALGCLPKRVNSCPQKKNPKQKPCIQMFIATLLTIA